jgi:hypothetical protein
VKNILAAERTIPMDKAADTSIPLKKLSTELASTQANASAL